MLRATDKHAADIVWPCKSLGANWERRPKPRGCFSLPAMQRHGRAGLEKGVLEREFHVAVGSAK